MSKKKNKLITQLDEETDTNYSPPISPTLSHNGTETGSFLGGKNMDQGGMSNPSPSLYSSKSENRLIETRLTSTSMTSERADLVRGLQAKNIRYRNLVDLKRALGEEKLDSFLVPEVQSISETMRKKKITVQKKNDIKDEFE